MCDFYQANTKKQKHIAFAPKCMDFLIQPIDHGVHIGEKRKTSLQVAPAIMFRERFHFEPFASNFIVVF